jgi:hypothetical protein
MDADKKEELLVSLLRELAHATERGHFGPSDRVKWLGDQLENYVERWVGFTAALPVQKTSPANDTLFGIVEIGADVLGAELRGRGDHPGIKSWQRFEVALEDVRRDGDGKRAGQLREALAQVRAEIGSLTW